MVRHHSQNHWLVGTPDEMILLHFLSAIKAAYWERPPGMDGHQVEVAEPISERTEAALVAARARGTRLWARDMPLR
jgi:hypothetical protein